MKRSDTVEPRYNEVLGTMEITLLYQDSRYIRVKKKYIQFDLSYPAMSGPALIRIRDLAGYGRLNV